MGDARFGGAYNSPQIQRKYLIPLAEKFVESCEDPSSLQEFIDFILSENLLTCTKSNVKNWRKDALKALRFVSAKSIMEEEFPPTPVNNSNNKRPTVDESVDSPDKVATPTPKRVKLSEPSRTEVRVNIPSKRVEEIADTVPTDLLDQFKVSLKFYLTSKNCFNIWPTLLINGPPFCGKTTLVESVCGSLQANYVSVSVGLVTATIRSWREIFNQAKGAAPCVLHIKDIENMEKHNTPVGSFRVVCLLKEELLNECSGRGVAVVGETRKLLASLPQDVTDLFTRRFTFGMMDESCRKSLLSRFLVESTDSEEMVDLTTASTEETGDDSRPQQQQQQKLVLSEGLSIQEVARRTPGYEAGDLIRLVGAVYMKTLELEEASLEDTERSSQLVTRSMLEAALNQVVPAVKNTPEFVTIPDVSWNDVGGLEDIKSRLHDHFMLLINDWERAQVLGRRSGGVLLEGPPGCGKTLIAKAFSNTAGLNFLSVKGPEVLNKFQGESERRVREIFERARACQPCLVFFDEIDAICPRRDGDETSGSRVSVVNQFLVELDGIDRHRQARVFVLGATNRRDMIDEAVLRHGRLGLHLRVPPPASAAARASVLAACTRGATRPPVVGGLEVLNRIAKDPRTEGMSGADLDNVLENAKLSAHLAQRDFLEEVDFQKALEKVSESN